MTTDSLETETVPRSGRISRRIALFSRARLLISGVLALGAAITTGVSFWTSPYGNSPDKVQRAGRLLNELSLRKLNWEEAGRHTGDSLGATNAFSELLAARLSLLDVWDEIEQTSRELTFPNDRILRAKAMVLVNENLLTHTTYEWDNRLKYAKKRLVVSTTSNLITKCLQFGVLAALVCFVASWVALPSLSWLWYFALDRIRELSGAVKGN